MRPSTNYGFVIQDYSAADGIDLTSSERGTTSAADNHDHLSMIDDAVVATVPRFGGKPGAHPAVFRAMATTRTAEPWTAAPFVPEQRSLKVLRDAARGCRGCPLWKLGTQTVFGEGPSGARVVLTGEQPGDREDLAGRPFVGPAGRLLDQALETAGIRRNDVYVTNAVKHFKWEPAGKRRLHKKPTAREIAACRPWLDAELATLEPEIVVALGATAAQALMGADFRVTRERGKIIRDVPWARAFVATVHPSSILRGDPEEREAALAAFVTDLKVVASLLGGSR